MIQHIESYTNYTNVVILKFSLVLTSMFSYWQKMTFNIRNAISEVFFQYEFRYTAHSVSLAHLKLNYIVIHMFMSYVPEPLACVK